MIIDNYIIREIAKPLLAGCVILIAVFAGARAADYLADAAEGLLLFSTVFHLIALRILTALEVLLPIALYLSVVGGIGRLYADSEITALQGAGISELGILRGVLKLSLLCAVVVGCLAVYVRPWAYQQSYELQNQAQATFSLSKLEEDRFYANPAADITLFVEDVVPQRRLLQGVFLRQESADTTQLVYAQEARPLSSGSAETGLLLNQGYLYTLDHSGNRDLSVDFKELTLKLEDPDIEAIGYKRKAASTGELLKSKDPQDIAELQWRLSRPLATILLGLLGVPLSRATPRQGKFAKGFIAILIYALYYNASAIAKTWVEKSIVAPLPGIWWSEALLALVLIGLLLWPSLTFRSSRR